MQCPVKRIEYYITLKGIAALWEGQKCPSQKGEKMKLIIDIPEEEYELKKELSKIPNLYESDCFNIDRAIANGTPVTDLDEEEA